jgi:formiminotetrahydrofolate cyclodeaminase
VGYESETVGGLLSEVASPTIAPAGGTCAAVVGATGAALCEMACIHTVRKDGEANAAAEITATGEELAAQRERLLGLADADAEAAEALFDALDGGRGADREAKRATGVPLAVAESGVAVIEAAAVLARDGTDTILPDVVTGAFCADAARRSAVFTVRANADHLEDPSFVEAMDRRTAEIEAAAAEAFENVEAASGAHGRL